MTTPDYLVTITMGILVIILMGFVAGNVGYPNYAAPNLCIQEGDCICPCYNNCEPMKYEDWGSTPNQPICQECSIKWYFWCVIK